MESNLNFLVERSFALKNDSTMRFSFKQIIWTSKQKRKGDNLLVITETCFGFGYVEFYTPSGYSDGSKQSTAIKFRIDEKDFKHIDLFKATINETKDFLETLILNEYTGGC